MKAARLMILAALTALIACLIFLLATTAGLRTALHLANSLAGAEMKIAANHVEGRLLGRIVLADAEFETTTLKVGLRQAELLWHPQGLLRGKIVIERLMVTEGSITLSAGAEDNHPSEGGIGWLPDVSLEALEILSLQVNTATENYAIERISGKATLESGQLTLSQAELLLSDLSANLTGSVNLQLSTVTDLQLQWDWQTAELLQPFRGSVTLNGDTGVLQLSAVIDSPADARISADVEKILTTPTWNAEFSMEKINLQRDVSAGLPEVDLLLQGRSNGSVDRASLDATGSVVFDGIVRPWNIDANVPLRDDSYPLLTIRSGPAIITLTPDDTQMDKAFVRLDIPDLGNLWPGLAGKVNGDGELLGPRTRPAVNLSLSGNNLVAGEHTLRQIKSRLQFDSALMADSPLHIVTTVDKAHVAGHDLDGDLQLDGTVKKARLNFSLSEIGQGELQLQMQGGVANGALAATIEKMLINHPVLGQWQTVQNSDLMLMYDTAKLSHTCLQRKDASICGEISWLNNRLDTQLNVKTLQLETVPWLDQLGDYQLTGRLDGELDAVVDSSRVERFSADINLSQGALTHRMENGQQHVMKFRTVSLKGSDNNGKLQLKAELADDNDSRLLSSLAVPADLQLLMEPETAITGQLEADLSRLDSLNVFLQHTILPAGKLRADISLNGSLQAPRFSGDAELLVPVAEVGEPITVFTQSSLKMQLDGSEIKLQGRSELAGQPLQLNGFAHVTSVDDWNVDMALQADEISLAAIPAISLQDDFTLAGTLQGKLHIAVDNKMKVNRLDAELTLGEGVVRRNFIDGEEEELRIHSLSIQGHNEKDQLFLTGRLQDAYQGRLEMKLALPAQLYHLYEPGLVLDGSLTAGFTNLQAFGIFLDDVSIPAGSLSANISLTGSRAAPQLKGKATLTVPRLDLIEPVIGFDKTQLDIELDGNKLHARGGSFIDDRPIRLEGLALLQTLDDWNASLQLTAESVRLDNIFGSSLQASPDLALLIEPGMVKLTGDVVVENSEIVIRDLSSTIRPSSDVRIVSEEQESSPSWRVISDLGLRLSGENRLRVAGFNGLLGGSVRVRSESGKLASGAGALTVTEGVYRAFGTTVPIRSGRLEFIGGTLDDPAIQIESRRRVEQREVGFDVTGTLQSPVVTLVSNPSMDQSEILSWLLFGRAAGDSSGASAALLASSIQSAFGKEEEESFIQRMLGGMGMAGIGVETSLTSGVGLSKQLTPRLFIKYRVDIWEQTNRLILRYQLGQHWALEGISGDEGGADILYERER